MKVIQPRNVSTPVGNYVHGLEVTGGRLLFISGQIPEDTSGNVPNDFEAQCRQVWQNILSVLDAAGMSAGNLVKVTTFLTDRDQADLNGDIRREVLGEHAPALTVMVAQTLNPAWLLEIEAVAFIPIAAQSLCLSDETRAEREATTTRCGTCKAAKQRWNGTLGAFPRVLWNWTQCVSKLLNSLFDKPRVPLSHLPFQFGI